MESSESLRESTPLQIFAALWPFIIGAAISRISVSIGCYGSFAATDAGPFTDITSLSCVALLVVAAIALGIWGKSLKDNAVMNTTIVAVAIQAAALLALCWQDFSNSQIYAVQVACGVLCTLGSIVTIFCWMRLASCLGARIAFVFVFSSIALSEVVILLCGLLPRFAQDASAVVMLTVQLLLFGIKAKPGRIEGLVLEDTGDYLGFNVSPRNALRILAVMAAGVGFFSMVMGFLIGFPDGYSTVFTLRTRVGYSIIATLVCLIAACLALRRPSAPPLIGMFVCMEACVCLALLALFAFPHAPEIGGMFTNVALALLVGFMRYMVMAFMQAGTKERLFYACEGWIVWLGSKAVTRLGLMALYPLVDDYNLLGMIMAVLVAVSAMVSFGGMAFVARNSLPSSQSLPPSEKIEGSSVLKFMGLQQAATLADVRLEVMRTSVDKMCDQFKLTKREGDVAALYCMGFTQRRVAEELGLSQSTVHEYIKRLYAKTNLHSRQEIIDYLHEFA